MRCQNVQDQLLTDYIDNELSEADKKSIHVHLASCQRCREFEEMLKHSAIPVLKSEDHMIHPVPDTLWDRIKETIDEEGMNDNRAKVFFPKFFLEAACAAAILFIIYSLHYTPLFNMTSTKGDYLACLNNYLGYEKSTSTGYDAALNSVFNKG